jgi:class 3 adenylate cyclase
LQAYSRHPKISHRFGEKYAIKMSFALHTGSAIEGAIGSEFKVDASYLSTDLQILHRIDQLCDVYDRTILITGDLQKMMSDRAKETTRKIETIVMKESPTTQRVS